MKEAVLPFNRFPGVDTILGPEMRSTGEVMGIGATFGLAFAKSQMAAGNRLPVDGTVFFSLADRDKPAGLGAARQFAALGFDLAATSGTAVVLEANGLDGRRRSWPRSATSRPGWSTRSTSSRAARSSSWSTRRVAAAHARTGDHIRAAARRPPVPCLTTVAAARAAAAGIADWLAHPLSVRSLQEYHRR